MGALMDASKIALLQRGADWSGVRVTVAGVGVAGFAAADALLRLGAAVTVVDAAAGSKQRERALILETLGASVLLGEGENLPASTDLLVVSPGLPPGASITRAARAAGVPVWGELELAWRLRKPGAAAWLMITGTNGKTTTTLMLESMLRAAGLRTIAAGNIGYSMVDVVMNEATPEGELDAVAVEVGAPQLPFLDTVAPLAAICLNVAEDHVDLFGTFDAYQDAKARIYRNTQVAAVYNDAEPITRQMVEDADVAQGCRAIGITVNAPAIGMLGVVDGSLVDRAFIAERATSAAELAAVSDVQPNAAHNVSNALAAAALARAAGVPQRAVRDGLRSFTPAGHRIADAGVVNGVRYVDDSKATNCHAAQTSLLSYEPVVWIAGGMAKGQQFDELVAATAARMSGVVLLGVDRELIGAALARHAPDVPVVEVSRTDTGAMTEVVAAASRLARPGDTVLLAPGCASWDMFDDYAQRGALFATAVAELGARQTKGGGDEPAG
ncbi:MAG: UDP-N-acetylmuramoyl-L-alanine--D-glutamate ligase [Candidatus Nanopelagicales bacterium]